MKAQTMTMNELQKAQREYIASLERFIADERLRWREDPWLLHEMRGNDIVLSRRGA